MNKTEFINQIVERIFQLNDPPIAASLRGQITDFLGTIINGDTVKQNLVINAMLGKDKAGVIVYALTSVRVIKIDIDAATGEMKSSDFFLHKTSIEWKAGAEGTEIKVSSPPNSFSLKYIAQPIIDFFKMVDETRVIAEASHDKR